MKTPRKIKAQPRHIYPKWSKKYIVPSLLLTGKWLQLAGFEALELVTVEFVANGQILLTSINYDYEKAK